MPTKQLNKKPTTPRPATVRRAASGAPIRGTAQGDQHMEALCSLTNPFCDDAKHARLPDVGAGTSFTEQVRWVQSFSSDVGGSMGLAIIPKVDYPYLTDTGAAWDAASVGNNESLLKTQGRQYRITSYGIRIISLMSATDSKGSISLATGHPASVGGPSIQGPDYYAHYDIHAIGPNSEWHMIGKPTGSESTDWQLVSDYNTTTADATPGWTGLYLLASGLPADTAVFRVEVVINYEYLFETTSALRKLQSEQPVFNPQLLAARNEVMSKAAHVVKGAKAAAHAHLKQEARKALTKHVLPFIAKKGLALLG